ncbi:major facilitator transporter [Oenococcus oeni]|nr:major facilitator transporter [Oenococcus oeni]
MENKESDISNINYNLDFSITKSKTERHLKTIALCVTLGGLLFGVDTGVINGALPYMAKKQELNLNAATEGLVTSSITLGAAFGAIFAGRLADRYGRKRILFYLSIIFFFCTAICSLAPNAIIMMIFRFLLGLAVGGASVIVPTFLSEVATVKLRGPLVTQNEIMITGGQLLAFVVNAILGNIFVNVSNIWRYMIAFGMVPSALLFIGTLIVPESPRWLIMKGKTETALKILKGIRSNKQESQQEITQIQAALKKEKEVSHISWHDLKKPWIRKLIILGSGLGIVQQVVGINIIMYYGTTILINAGFTHNIALITNIANGIVSVLATYTGMRLMNHINRRKMLLTGITGTGGALALITLFSQMLPHSKLLPVCVVFLTLIFLSFFQGCISPTIWLLMSEIFPQNLRGLGMGISTFFLWMANFLVGFLFPIFLTYFGFSITFGIFVLCNLISFIFVYKFAPETRNKSLERVQLELRAKINKH